MKLAGLPVERLAATIQAELRAAGADAVLTGGSCVTIYARGRYVSRDLDFVTRAPRGLRDVEPALARLGFRPEGRVYRNPEVDYVVDILAPPLSVGNEPAQSAEIKVGRLVLKLLTATDCVKDRLAWFYFNDDPQGLEQALLVCLDRDVDLREVRRWSLAQDAGKKHRAFRLALARRRRAGR